MGYEQILIRKSTMRNQDMIIAQSGRGAATAAICMLPPQQPIRAEKTPG